MAFPSQAAARDAVRALLRDGQTTTYATNVIFNLARQESLSDEIPAVATPVQTEFYVRFSTVPLGKNVTVYAIPGTIAAYVDGGNTPQTVGNGGVTQDIDLNGNFILRAAPTGQLLVTYGWQVFNDGDIDQYIADADSWLFQWTDGGGIAAIPDQLNHALALYAAAQGAFAISRQMALPDVTAGEAKEALSGVGKMYAQSAKAWLAEAMQARKDYWTSADQPLQPAAGVLALAYPSYQPKR